MTTFFFRRSIEMAFQLDEQPSGLSLNLTKPLISNPPYITSAVDDVMYILNQVIERSLLTSQREVVSNVIPSIFRVLGSDFIGMIQRKMRDECYPRAVSQGSLPPEQITISFLVLVNGLDVAAEYIKRIIQPRIEESPGAMLVNIENSPSSTSLSKLYPFNDDAEIITNLLRTSLQSFENKTFELIGDSIHVIMKNIIKPRLRPVLVDSFRDIDYEMTPNDLERLNEQTEADGDHENSVEATVQYRFQHGWDALIKPIARVSTVRNYERVLSAAVLYLSEVLEKRIWSYYGRINNLGAIRLERDVTSIISIAVKGGRYGLRDTFGKCAQICLVMNMEEDEWEDLQASCINKVNDEIEWKIDSHERFRARAMIRGA